MDFSLNEIQAMLADSIEKFIANDYDFDTRQSLAASETGFSDTVWKQFAELGWTAVPFSEDDGGFDGGPIDIAVVMERFGQGLIVEPYLANVILAGGILKRIASDDQKARWLHPMMAGETQLTLAFAEPQSRYDIENVQTTAAADGDSWLLNGTKAHVLNGGTADVILVPAVKGGRISIFAVEASATSVKDYPTVDGLRAAEVTLDNTPGELIGSADEGLAALAAAVDDATLAISAEALGIMNALTQKTIEYTKSREQFGVPISSFQALQHRMVDMYTACEQTRSLLMWATMTVAEGGADSARAINALKYQIGTAGRYVAEESVQLHGGMGVTWELDVAHYFKRLIAIDQTLGNADWHLDQLT